jgi:hypothetical protein
MLPLAGGFEVQGQQLAGGDVGVQQALLDQPADCQARRLHLRGLIRVGVRSVAHASAVRTERARSFSDIAQSRRLRRCRAARAAPVGSPVTVASAQWSWGASS